VWAAKLGGDGDQVRRLLMEARLIGAYEARRLGLIDRVVSAWRLEEKIVAWSTGMAEAVAAGAWAPSSELKIFRSLWMGPRHRAALERWSIGPRKDRPGKP
jgi:enoyl-CoA hydratase/carnithine racemase